MYYRGRLALITDEVFEVNFPYRRQYAIRELRDVSVLQTGGEILPIVLTAVAAVFMRMTRSSLLETMRQDYIRTARAKGLREQEVLWGHALRNSLIPLVTVAGVQVGYLLGGAVVTEEVFTLPGVGRLLLWGVFQRDYPLVQGTILFISALFMVSNLVVDLLYAYVDPRIRRG